MANASRGQSLGRLIFKELLSEFAFGRMAELFVRALPNDVFLTIADAIPESIRNKDDVQDAIALIPLAIGQHRGLPEPLRIGLMRLTKETLETIGERAREIPRDPQRRRDFVHGIIATQPGFSAFKHMEENMFGFGSGGEKKKSSKQLGFLNLLAEAPEGTQEKFRNFLYDPFNFTSSQREEWLTKLANVSTTPERVKALCNAPSIDAFRIELKVLVDTEPSLTESLLSKAARRLGLTESSFAPDHPKVAAFNKGLSEHGEKLRKRTKMLSKLGY